MRELIFRDQAIRDVNDWLGENPKLMRRIMRIVDECRRTPFEGLGKPEPLKGNTPPAVKAALPTSRVLPTKRAVSITPVGPTKMPLGLIKNTAPLL